MNAELIKALRECEYCNVCSIAVDGDCPFGGRDALEVAAADALEADEKRTDGLQKLVDINTERCEALRKQLREAHENYEKHLNELEAQLPKEGEWIMDEHPHDGDCRCSVCLVAIDAMHERNHGLLNALTGGKWWKFYKYCPNCGARMRGSNDEADC